MATRVSPRSNVSSASSSSTSSSRKSYRNPSFSNDRDKHDSDVWVGHNRNSHVAKQIQHDKRGNRGPNLAPAYKSWGNSGSSMTEESESRMSWRSQKQASNSLSNSRDTARSQNIDQHDASYVAYSPQGQRTANMSNRDNANLIGKHFRGHQKSSGLDEPWGFSPQGQSRGHARKDRWNNTNFPAEHGLRVKESGAGSRFEQPQKQNSCTSDNSLHGNMNSSNIGPHSDHTRMQRRESFRHHSSQASMSSHCPGTSGTSMTFLQGSRHQADVSVSAFERGAEVSRTQVHHKGWEVPSQSRTGTSGFGTRLDDFPPLTTGCEIEQRYVEVARPLYSGITGPWQNVRAVTGSWADECSDDVPETCDTEAISFNTVYGENWASSNAATPRMSNRNRYSYNGHDVHVADRGRWQRGSLYNSSVSVAADTSISSPNSRKKGPDVEQVQSSRSSLSFGQGFRRSTPISSDERSGQADNVSKERFSSKQEAHFKADKGGQEPVVSKDKVFAEVANIEFSDEAALPFIMGTCKDMCPSKEREQRERLKDLAVFERLNNNPSKTSRELAVKKFCRSFTGVKLAPDDVRPLHVLWSTLQYLLNLLDDSEFSFDVIHNFLFDRTRAIRQELGMQRIANSQAINMPASIFCQSMSLTKEGPHGMFQTLI
ncbi:hypothetical protein KP509_18G038000 [Ceratopteris richardii]|uniref:SAC3/GANP/THP3 conserved domain-containing protein n=1 Tax=Ceratopteris richardii TaxID=49495 RepID=A0A8T2SSJ9_CERRI|nr:hypothetical protein KP509_18G038000 [Ceratopteris richardii]KAH7365620.1 hypothetical protein KP509_18G038000 [Ceratopteris richardii]